MLKRNKCNTMRYARLSLAITAITCSQVQAQMGTDLWLGKLVDDTKRPIRDLIRLTNTVTDTTQPYFIDNENVLYIETSESSISDQSAPQTDVFQFSLVLGTSNNLTDSNGNEFFPRTIPGKYAISLIQANNGEKQALWEFNMQGNATKHLVPKFESLGAHAWINHSQLLLFVLGEPNTLQFAENLDESTGSYIDDNIGPSISRFQQSDWFLYSRKSEEGHWLKSYHTPTKKIRQIMALPEDSEYFAVSNSGYVFTSDGASLFQRQIYEYEDKIKAHEKWQKVSIPTDTITKENCATGISNIAISPDDTMVALVCQRADGQGVDVKAEQKNNADKDTMDK